MFYFRLMEKTNSKKYLLLFDFFFLTVFLVNFMFGTSEVIVPKTTILVSKCLEDG